MEAMRREEVMPRRDPAPAPEGILRTFRIDGERKAWHRWSLSLLFVCRKAVATMVARLYVKYHPCS